MSHGPALWPIGRIGSIMKNVKMRNWLIATMVCMCSSVGMGQFQNDMDEPIGDSARWIVDADGQSVDAGINRFILRPGAGKHELDIIVLGDLEHMALANLDLVHGQSNMDITMLSNGDQLELSSDRFSIEVRWNSQVMASVQEGDIIFAVDDTLEGPAVDVMGALTRDENLRHALQRSGQSPSSGSDCKSLCRDQHPKPTDCDGWWDEYVCCVTEAEYDFCQRACECYSIKSKPKMLACLTGASALFIAEGQVCAADFLWFLW